MRKEAPFVHRTEGGFFSVKSTCGWVKSSSTMKSSLRLDEIAAAGGSDTCIFAVFIEYQYKVISRKGA